MKCDLHLNKSPYFQSLTSEAREAVNKEIKEIYEKFGDNNDLLQANLKPFLERQTNNIKQASWAKYYDSVVINEMESQLYNGIKKKLGTIKTKKDYQKAVSDEIGNFIEVNYQRQLAIDVKAAQELEYAFNQQGGSLREFYRKVENNKQFSKNVTRELANELKGVTGDAEALSAAKILREFSDRSNTEWGSVNPYAKPPINYMGVQGHRALQNNEYTAEQWYNLIKNRGINDKAMYEMYGIRNTLEDYTKFYNQIKVGEKNIDSPFMLNKNSSSAQLSKPLPMIIFNDAESSIWYNENFNYDYNIWHTLVKPSVGLRKKADLYRVIGPNPLHTLTKLKQNISAKLDGTKLSDGTVIDHTLTDRLFGWEVQGSMFEKSLESPAGNLHATQLNNLLGNNRGANDLIVYAGQKSRGLSSSFALGKVWLSALTDPGKFFGLKKVLQHNTGEVGEFGIQALSSLTEAVQSFLTPFMQAVRNVPKWTGMAENKSAFQQEARELFYNFDDVFAGMVQETMTGLVKPNALTKRIDQTQELFSFLNMQRSIQETEAIMANNRVLQNLARDSKLSYGELSKEFKSNLERLKIDEGMWNLIGKKMISTGPSGQPKINPSLVDSITMKDILQAAKDSDYIATLLESRGITITKAKNDIAIAKVKQSQKDLDINIAYKTDDLRALEKQRTALEKRISKEKSPEEISVLREELSQVEKQFTTLQKEIATVKNDYSKYEQDLFYREGLQEKMSVSEKRKDFRNLQDIESELTDILRTDIQSNVQNQLFSSINAMVNIYRNKGTSASDALKSFGTRAGTVPGELIRSLNHLLSWPFALRENITKNVGPTTALSMFALAIAGDMMRKSLQDVVEGREIRDWTKAENILQTAAYSQVWGVYMEYLLKLANVAVGEEFSDKIGSFSPVLGKGFDILQTTGRIAKDVGKGIADGKASEGAIKAKDRLAMFAKRTFTQYPAQYLAYQILSAEAQAKDDKKRLKRK